MNLNAGPPPPRRRRAAAAPRPFSSRSNPPYEFSAPLRVEQTAATLRRNSLRRDGSSFLPATLNCGINLTRRGEVPSGMLTDVHDLASTRQNTRTAYKLSRKNARSSQVTWSRSTDGDGGNELKCFGPGPGIGGLPRARCPRGHLSAGQIENARLFSDPRGREWSSGPS